MLKISLTAIFLFLFSAIGMSQNKPIRIGVLNDHLDAAEKEAIRKMLDREKGWTVQWLSLEDVAKGNALKSLTHLWYHRTDTSALQSDERNLGAAIRAFVKQGGNLFLSMEAAPLVHDWGFEDAELQFQQDTLVDEGFGRPAGFHAFKSHPLFHAMNGGAYTTKQKQDHVVRKHGFFGKSVPVQGLVAGIQWTYITFTESGKLLLEYHYGKGKVIVAGAYLYYAADNYNYDQLRRFTENVFRYTSGRYNKENRNYWTYQPRTFTKQIFELPAQSPVAATAWHLPAPSIQLKQTVATNDFYDLVGRRMLWMGKMKGGADEIWVHPFMALRDLRIGIIREKMDTVTWLDQLDPAVEITPEYLVRSYHLPYADMREMYTVSFDRPNAVAHLEIKGEVQSIVIQYASSLRYMWPYSDDATGSFHYGFNKAINGHIISGQQGSLNTLVTYSEKPIEEKMETDEQHKQVLVKARFPVGRSGTFNMYLMASGRSLEEAVSLYRDQSSHMSRLAEQSQHYYKRLLSDHLNFETPDTLFNQGYRWALARTDQFLQTTPGLGTALMAGFGTTARGWNGNQPISGRPGYAWYFGRDGEWSAMAINDYGDYDMVKQVLETFIRYQDLNGKIYHELTSSGAAHYDAADATPLFVVLAAQYLRTSGDTAYIRQRWPAILKALEFCYSTDSDKDGLIENTNVGHGWIEGGSLFGTHTEFYLAGCWAATLDAAAYMAGMLHLPEAKKYAQDASKVKEIINTGFWNEQTQFFHNGKMRDGSYMPDATVLAAVPVYLNAVTDKQKAKKVAGRLANRYFSSDWGVRIIEDSARKYRPGSYHAGMVWPLYGGWAALAEYQSGFARSGYRHIMNNLLVYRNWALGSIEETLNGDTYRPNGVCSHQAWSETMVLQPAIEGMLGYAADAPSNTLYLSPAFPWNWNHCRVSRIRMGKNRFQLGMNKNGNETAFSILADEEAELQFSPKFPLNSSITSVTINGKPVSFSAESRGEVVLLPLKIHLQKGRNEVLIFSTGGIGALPVVPLPRPGDSSLAVTVVEENFQGNMYKAVVSGIPGASGEIRLYHQGPVQSVKGAAIVKQSGELLTLRVELPVENAKYVEHTIEVSLY